MGFASASNLSAACNRRYKPLSAFVKCIVHNFHRLFRFSGVRRRLRVRAQIFVNLISDALPFGGVWYGSASDAIDYAKFFSRSHDAVIRVTMKRRSDRNARAYWRFQRTVTRRETKSRHAVKRDG
jgi:hypothetical protein